MTDQAQNVPAQITKGHDRSVLARHVPLAIILIGAAIGAFFLRDLISYETLRDNREALLAFRDENFLGFAASFVAVYVLIVAFSLPGATVASATGGFLFGLAAGTALNVFAATVGASLIFFIARAGLGDMLMAKLEASDGKLKKLQNGLKENEISVLFVLRLVPAVPFFVANFLPALVGVKFINFLWTTALGIIPGALVFTWIGVGIGEAFESGSAPDLSIIWSPQVLGPILGLAALAALPIVIKALRGKKEI